MRPLHEFSNGHGGGDSGSMSGSGSGSGGDSGAEDSAAEAEHVLRDAEAPARALLALNALRKSRQHYDVLLLAAGAEVPAHRALLAAHSPYLLRALAEPATAAPAAAAPAPAGAPAAPPAADAYRVEGVEAEALRELVEYAYTGRLRWCGAAGARALYVAAWRLRADAPRAALAERLLRRPTPADCLELRALPDLPPPLLSALDEYIAHNFDAVCSAGALAALPLVRIEMVRASSSAGGAEAALAVADAALAWLRDGCGAEPLAALCARTHLLYVDAGGALRDCGELPAARGDAPELHEYRREAAERRREPAPAASPAEPREARALPGRALGARERRPEHAVLAARGAESRGGARVTRALLVVRGALAAARVAWRDVASGGHAGAAGAGTPLGGAAARHEPAAGERRAALPLARAALGAAALGGRLLVCGGYDRVRVLRDAAAYCARANAWTALPAMRSARARFPAARLGDALFALGGSDGLAELDSVDVLEAGAWRGAARLPLARAHAGAAADEARGALLVVGGCAGGRPLRLVHRYEARADAWREAAPLRAARSQCGCAVWRGAAWALGGCDAWHCLASTERLPLDAPAAWEPGPALPTARRSVGAAAWRARLVSAGGSDGAASLRRVDWLGDDAHAPHAQLAWRAGPALRRARAALGLAVLDDVLYAVGGFDGKEFLSCVECLHAPDGEWTALCAPPAPSTPPAPGTPGAPPALGTPSTPPAPGTPGAPPALGTPGAPPAPSTPPAPGAGEEDTSAAP